MPEVLEAKKRGRGRPPGAKNKPKPPITKVVSAKEIAKIRDLMPLGINSLRPGPRVVKEMRRLAEETGFTIKRIYDDMCEAGIIDIQSMYLEVINARREMQKALDLLDGKTTAQTPDKQEPAIRNGESPEEVRPVSRGPRAANAGPREPRETPAQPDVAPIGRGLSTSPNSDPEDNFSVGLTDDEPEPEEPEEVEPETGDA